ncbi:ribonuclease D [Parvibacter caecicola]|uniref:Ribonuclease D n=1 Tax=Parvibacter caecicola TaxID=747645 RepID=A0A7W5D0U0_9ACTN|nr:ribonuclease D [Parvibacter caecicola]MBB3170607.1 ribonuclease D [Parvibacter caecicola]MCR2041432.1 ribonuclease D [Parvibacter caecicola]RNL12015.1 ribonuclease D [Parvibacter caecicola]
MYIDNQESLEAFVRRARSSGLLAIDTEFLRESTYYPKLCLLQMATDSEVVLIDPFKVPDLAPLRPLLEDQSIVKLFHAGGQDLEIIYRKLGVLPTPLFDTQIAASVLGHPQQIGYGALVAAMCGKALKKSDSFTDWSLRPLKESQLEYAADDVIYLPQVYRVMIEKLQAKGREQWLQAEFDELGNPARYHEDPRERYKRLKRGSSLNRRQLAAAREVAAWRELKAQRVDRPRKWVLTDEQIVEACKRGARTIDELFMVRGVREKLSTRDAREVVALIAKGMDLSEDQLPKPERPSKSEPNVDIQVDLMEALARLRAKESDIALHTLASRDDLAAVARGHRNVAVLKGWRRTILGNELLDLAEGRIALAVSENQLKIIPLS